MSHSYELMSPAYGLVSQYVMQPWAVRVRVNVLASVCRHALQQCLALNFCCQNSCDREQTTSKRVKGQIRECLVFKSNQRLNAVNAIEPVPHNDLLHQS